MRYKSVIAGTFVSRPNRFIAHVMVGGAEVVCHVKNTGRCRELLVPGARVVLSVADNPARKTKYDLVAVWKGERLINMDSQAPNVVFGEWARKYGLEVRPETKYGNSRFDFYYRVERMTGAAIPQASRPAPFAQGSPGGGVGEALSYAEEEGETGAAIPQASRPAPFAQGSPGGGVGKALSYAEEEGETGAAIPQASRPAPFAQGSPGEDGGIAPLYNAAEAYAMLYNSRNSAGFIEVKGVTLENDGVARFPDAPTERGAKHVRELIKCREDGYGAHIAFVVQMAGMKYVTPNYDTDPVFAAALRDARDAGVNIIALECAVTPDSMEITGFLPVRLD